MKKTTIFASIFCILHCSGGVCLSQDTGHNHIFGLMPYVGYSSTANQGSSNGQAAVISAEGGFMVDASQANINNQQAYSMQLDNHLKRVNTFFEGRQTNSFYRDLEAWQKKQRAEFKKYGMYDREAIRYIYGR